MVAAPSSPNGDVLTNFPDDPECSIWWRLIESLPGVQCRLGAELVFVLPVLMGLRRARARFGRGRRLGATNA